LRQKARLTTNPSEIWVGRRVPAHRDQTAMNGAQTRVRGRGLWDREWATCLEVVTHLAEWYSFVRLETGIPPALGQWPEWGAILLGGAMPGCQERIQRIRD